MRTRPIRTLTAAVATVGVAGLLPALASADELTTLGYTSDGTYVSQTALFKVPAAETNEIVVDVVQFCDDPEDLATCTPLATVPPVEVADAVTYGLTLAISQASGSGLSITPGLCDRGATLLASGVSKAREGYVETFKIVDGKKTDAQKHELPDSEDDGQSLEVRFCR